MNLSRCLTVVCLVLSVAVALCFLVVFLTKKSNSNEDSSETTTPSSELKKLEKQFEETVNESKKLTQNFDEVRDQMNKGILEEHSRAIKELDRKHKAAIESLKEQYKTDITKHIDLKPLQTPELQLIFDVPYLDMFWSYNINGEKINVSKDDYPVEDIVKYTHQRESGYFNLKSVKIGSKSFPIEPPVDNVILVSVYALVVDSSFPYYIIAGSKGNDPQLYENNGEKFVIAGEVATFKEEMYKKAKKFGRPIIEPSTTSFKQHTEPSLRKSPVPPQGSKSVFKLDANSKFQLGSDELQVTVSNEYENKYKSYLYFVKDKTICPDNFTVNGVVQKGLPVGKLLNGVVVYFATGVVNTPLFIKLLNSGEENLFFNSLDNNWTNTQDNNLEEQLDFLDSHINNRIVINLSRRSDYYRNGTGLSKFELSKDVNVYVETDKPSLGWNTYKHVYEIGGGSDNGEAHNFYVSRMISGNYKFLVCPKKEVQYVETYSKSDSNSTTPPPAVFVKYADGTHEYYLKHGSEYLDETVSNLGINANNLVQKMENALNE